MPAATPRFTLFIITFTCFSGCNLINPDEPVPSYIHIPSFSLKTGTGQGSATHKITDAWLYVDDDLKGIFEIPVTIPVLSSGAPEISISAGILDNGISDTRAIYPMYAAFKVNVDSVSVFLDPGKADTVKPVVFYRDSMTFYLIADFESSTHFITLEGDTAITTGGDSTHVLEGNYGLLQLNASAPEFEGISTDTFALPSGGIPVYIELDYKTNNAFTIGLHAIDGPVVAVREKVIVNPKEDWNKIYINLTQDIFELDAPFYQLYIKAEKSDNLSLASIYLDNLKLISR